VTDGLIVFETEEKSSQSDERRTRTEAELKREDWRGELWRRRTEGANKSGLSFEIENDRWGRD